MLCNKKTGISGVHTFRKLIPDRLYPILRKPLQAAIRGQVSLTALSTRTAGGATMG